MLIETIVVGDLKENCYILKKDSDCLIVDPGAEFDKIKQAIGKMNLLAVLVTHDHYDHIDALPDILKYYSPRVYQYSNLEQKEYYINNFSFEVIFTPGHSSDSVTYYFNREKCMFTGDFLFYHTVGYWHFETGSKNDMFKSIKMIQNYTNEVIIYPGHGKATTLIEEKTNNPYLFTKN